MSDQPPNTKPLTIIGILTDEEIKCLEKVSIIESAAPDSRDGGTCTVTMTRLQIKPSQLLSTPVPNQDDDQAGTLWKIKVPLAKESPPVLEFLGFTPSAASELWSGYTRQLSTALKPLKLMAYLCEHISLLQTPLCREMDIYKALVLVGIDRGIMRNLFNPTYSGKFKSKSLYNWVEHALWDRWLNEWEHILD
ncbi:uncharacterized protein N7473_012089 [Penicillium subrubescens]|uniref:uncharacterized protein n=1 Tax=Penicillium subrubescens TaxID=1316194 RepID=UPI002545267C|nr:uncharacterized protein N7473_012089 [Penicillium subrubescens]KAJ5881036.1 hypothetical protein N7473_012089 [Penicillium subrubescens]